MKIIPSGSVDVVFADPPYRLSRGGVTVKSGKLASVDKGAWDRSMGSVRTHLSAYLCGHTTCRGRGTVTHQSESAHQTSHWTVLCRMMQLDFREYSFHALRWISLWTMRQTPPGGIMYVVANPLEKNAGWPGEEEAAVSSEVEENKAIVRRFLEATARGDLAAMDEMIAPDFVDRSLMSGREPDREGFKRSVAEMDAPFTNQRVTIEDQIAEGDKVLTRVTYRATHDPGELLGIAPTGEEWALTAMYVHRIEGGKIAEEWTEASIDPWLQRLEEENRERERVEQEMRVARTIQQANLPKEMPTPEGWQLGLICQPAREVGGDFYDFHYLSDGRLGLVVGDATGKGVPAA